MLRHNDLIHYFSTGCKIDQKIGIEWEIFIFFQKTGDRLPYEDPNKPIDIKRLLLFIEKELSGQSIWEGEFIIGVEFAHGTITLEPAGQLEISTNPCNTVAEVEAILKRYLGVLAKQSDLISVAPKGYHPTPFSTIQWMPKKRYEIMRAYMSKIGTLGLEMMANTCSFQYCFDYKDELDLRCKAKIITCLTPIIMAVTANSSFLYKGTFYKSFRQHIWQYTDDTRCGLPLFMLTGECGFENYTHYALTVPMYFVRRHNKYVNLTGRMFSDFLNRQLDSHVADGPELKDWIDHTSTLFPELRLRPYLEIRCADSNDLSMGLAVAAFWKGILYNEEALNAAYQLIDSLAPHDILNAYHQVPEHSFQVTLDGKSLLAWWQEVLVLARQGLRGNKDENYLLPLLKS